MVSGADLVEATDSHFTWMLGESPSPDRLGLPPGGIDEAWVLRWLRRNLASFGQPGNWLVVAEGEVVGLCSYKTAPSADGAVEIGYGVAATRRRLGHATRAVELAIRAARSDPASAGSWRRRRSPTCHRSGCLRSTASPRPGPASTPTRAR